MDEEVLDNREMDDEAIEASLGSHTVSTKSEMTNGVARYHRQPAKKHMIVRNSAAKSLFQREAKDPDLRLDFSDCYLNLTVRSMFPWTPRGLEAIPSE
eukprot:6105624-Amphidinium_carterae.1